MNANPVFRAARREAVWTMVLWLVSLIYTVTVCYQWGYRRDFQEVRFILWFPDWVFWGVAVPWWSCILISTFFAYRVMTDEELEGEVPFRHDCDEVDGA